MENCSGSPDGNGLTITGTGGKGGDGGTGVNIGSISSANANISGQGGDGGKGGDGVTVGTISGGGSPQGGESPHGGGGPQCGCHDLMMINWAIVATPNSVPIPVEPDSITISMPGSSGVLYANKGDYTFGNNAATMTDTGYYHLIDQIGKNARGHYDVSLVSNGVTYTGKGICRVGC